MNDDYIYKDDDDLEVTEDITGEPVEDTFYDPEEEGISDFNFSDDEIPIPEAPNELEDSEVV